MTSDRRAGRPRDPRIEQAALGAARDLLVEGGWPALTVAAVAERAGTTKPALYRRWPSLPHLAYEAAFPDEVALDFTLTEDLHSDLAGIVTGIRTIFTSPIVAAALPGLLAEFSVHPHLHSSLLARFADGFETLDERLALAAENGEARPGVRAADLLQVAIGTVLLGVLLGPETLDDAWADRLTAMLWNGIAP
ncbi:MAG TPA: TetR/AcrR family transcriptional regulator [Marmoricola sp.]